MSLPSTETRIRKKQQGNRGGAAGGGGKDLLGGSGGAAMGASIRRLSAVSDALNLHR